jgi:hypothetical protein
MDTHSVVLELSRRIERLERANRWWRRAAVASVLTLIALLTIAQAPSPTAVKTIRASGFVLVNDVGNDVAEFGLVDHSPALSFLDGAKHPYSQLTATQLLLGTAAETEIGRVKLSVDGLSIVRRRRGGTREPRVLLDTTSGPSLTMLGDRSTVELTDLTNAVRLTTAGPKVEVSNRKEKAVLGQLLGPESGRGDAHFISSTPVGSLSLLDETGTPRFQVSGGAHPYLLVMDEQGRHRIAIGKTLPFPPESQDSPYTAMIFDESRSVQWRAPGK